MSVDPGLAALGAVFVFLASLLRGLTGFGFAIVASPLLALVLPPAVAAPIVVSLQIPAGLQTLATDWRETDVKAVAAALLGGAPAILPGLWLVTQVPADLMRVVVGLVVVLSTISLAVGLRLDRAPKTGELVSTGAMSGALMGAVGMAGPPVIVLLLASDWTARRCRATLSLTFFTLGCATFALGTASGVVTSDSLLLAALYTPCLFLGQFVGGRLFKRVKAERYRALSLLIVGSSGLMVLLRGLMG